jgi:hypothetical protein
VDRVGDVVGEVHDLRLEALVTGGRAGAQPVEDRLVVGVDAELPGRRPGGATSPRVFRARVEGGPGQVEPDRAPVGVDGLGLEPGEQPQRLGVALEAAARLAQLGERPLAVVTERRVAGVDGTVLLVDRVAA